MTYLREMKSTFNPVASVGVCISQAHMKIMKMSMCGGLIANFPS
jgi:hypothetical protein